MQIKSFTDVMLPALHGFIRKNVNDIADLQPGSSLKVFVSNYQIKGIVKNKNGEVLKLKKVGIQYR
jgi:hypothetical protein